MTDIPKYKLTYGDDGTNNVTFTRLPLRIGTRFEIDASIRASIRKVEVMTDIPREVMEAALKVSKVLFKDQFTVDFAAHEIARALLARDKRAAEIARAMPKMISMSPAHVRGLTGDDVAEAILTYPTGQEDDAG